MKTDRDLRQQTIAQLRKCQVWKGSDKFYPLILQIIHQHLQTFGHDDVADTLEKIVS